MAGTMMLVALTVAVNLFALSRVEDVDCQALKGDRHALGTLDGVQGWRSRQST